MRGYTTLTLLFFGNFQIQPPRPFNLRNGLQGQGMVIIVLDAVISLLG